MLKKEETLYGITKIWLKKNTAMTNNFFYNVNNLFNDEKINFLKKKKKTLTQYLGSQESNGNFGKYRTPSMLINQKLIQIALGTSL